MNNEKPRRLISERINAWLEEDAGALFKTNKWRFWYLTVATFQTLIGIGTWYLYPGQFGAILMVAAALLCWVALASMHYTDSGQERMDKIIAGVDAVALIFAALHLGFVLYVISHHEILQSREANYEVQRKEYNDRLQERDKSQLERERLANERAKIENDTAKREQDAAYWNARGGRRSSTPAPEASNRSTRSEERLERFDKPRELTGISAADFLADKDAIIRMLGAGELLIAVISLILIRWLSVKANHAGRGPRERDRIPDHLKDWWNSPEVQAQQAEARDLYAKIMRDQALRDFEQKKLPDKDETSH